MKRIFFPWETIDLPIISTQLSRGISPILAILRGREQTPAGRLRWYLRLTGLWLPAKVMRERGHWSIKAAGLSRRARFSAV